MIKIRNDHNKSCSSYLVFLRVNHLQKNLRSLVHLKNLLWTLKIPYLYRPSCLKIWINLYGWSVLKAGLWVEWAAFYYNLTKTVLIMACKVFFNRSRIVHCLVGMVRWNRQPLSATLAHDWSNCWNWEISDPFLFELVPSTNYCSFHCINNDEK